MTQLEASEEFRLHAVYLRGKWEKSHGIWQQQLGFFIELVTLNDFCTLGQIEGYAQVGTEGILELKKSPSLPEKEVIFRKLMLAEMSAVLLEMREKDMYI